MPFGDLGFGELLVVAVLALFVFGPERLPSVAADAATRHRFAVAQEQSQVCRVLQSELYLVAGAE
mgnify:CR=1 FL=1